ncbi:hypothetical protein CcaverHIS002_0206380 [Cutaneotrichosporon cavernicola]|uniref:AMP binding protein n=1 Tax=Cutaneotrichosporon cavernicola TaxID=279322 RepID=A0AA48L2K5_9TREE|nr:uncharacterized protein CcaverHIS019_0206350 [Cutaneotrichosporon cavernicola]BEI81478.1 hypothetical protein CcaverHIS002_0206380 [Cutaneotrichosporon cavernicola]BEI89273.1 hypothetical protein CcaverHIS019_0206350 [Cutaneotrichosporon cavernicola]BEI97049.1 hypothetical protein CcaverHIS631_0206380 [Cutaneotrichosporon cavernicola]BEJ04822.1 hypothetical protein CcaverHIS641_0206390 [Cutaneotrichosporon cavernicola]
MPEVIYDPNYPAPDVLPESGFYDYLFGDESPLGKFDKSLPAYIDGLDGRVLTRGGLENSCLRLVSGLRALGVQRNDVACLWGLNSLEWARTAYGCLAAGVTVSPANYAYAAHEIAHQLNDSGAGIIFLDPTLIPMFDAARKEIKRPFSNERVILLCTPERKPKELAQYKAFEEILGARAEPEHFTGSQIRDTAFLCYSSGTTGLPKGVMTTHNNMTSQLQALNIGYEQLESGRDTVLGILPYSHIYGLTIVFFQPFTVGVPLVVLPRFEEISVLSAIQKFKITHGLIVPPIIIILLNSSNVDNYDLSSVRTFMVGAAPTSPELSESFSRRFPHITLTQGYGMTECSPTTHVCNGAEVAGRAGWIGRLLPTFQARLVTEDGVDAAHGERGELWVRGPSVMKGYLNNPEATEKTMAPGGWYKTGDVLITDDQGWYKVVDRVKELIKYKGFQVAPAELEGLLLQHDKVADVGVIGVWEESQATELPRAYIVPKPSADLKSGAAREAFRAEIASWLADRVAQHKRLRGGVVIVETIPKSPSGKILRKDLRVRAQAERDAEVQLRAKM